MLCLRFAAVLQPGYWLLVTGTRTRRTLVAAECCARLTVRRRTRASPVSSCRLVNSQCYHKSDKTYLRMTIRKLILFFWFCICFDTASGSLQMLVASFHNSFNPIPLFYSLTSTVSSGRFSVNVNDDWYLIWAGLYQTMPLHIKVCGWRW